MANMKNFIITFLGVVGAGYSAYKWISDREPPKYSMAWIERLTDEQWEAERQFVQDQYRNPKNSISFRDNCKRLLDLFDKVKSNRDWAGQKPTGPGYHREHGYGLYKKE